MRYVITSNLGSEIVFSTRKDVITFLKGISRSLGEPIYHLKDSGSSERIFGFYDKESNMEIFYNLRVIVNH